jgi:hypothetical protein
MRGWRIHPGIHTASLNLVTPQTGLDGVCVRQKVTAAVNIRQNKKRTHKAHSRFLAKGALTSFSHTIAY